MLLLLLSACSQIKSKEKAATTKTTASSSESSPGLSLKDDKLNALYQQYTQLTHALVTDNAREARFAANAIIAVADKMNNGESISTHAARLIATADIEQQRIAYAALSNDLLVLIRQSGLQQGKLYVGFCPMAMNDKGAVWLSVDKTIQNPYFGAKMLTCGSIQETIE